MAETNTEREGLLTIGTLLANGKYRIEQYLSSGGFGNTYIATDLAFDEKVAIKELYIKGVCGRDGSTNDVAITLTENQRTFEAQREKFRKEARRLRRLSNAHIVKVHDLFDENGTSYYVMDFIEGESLAARLKRTGHPMAVADVLLLLPQVLDALETVHNAGIWHLDLKPANIMIDRQGNVQLIDFGASKQLRNQDGQSLSTSSALAYTPGYASSEQMEQNLEKFGPWTDLYSLGATVFNLLTLQQPPSPSDIDEDVNEALLTHLPEGIDTKVSELIVWLIKPNRKMRPQSVADVRQYLSETIGPGKGGQPKPPRPAPRQAPAPQPITQPAADDPTMLNTRMRKKAQEPKPEEPEATDEERSPWMRRGIIIGIVALIAGGFVIGSGISILPRSCTHEASAPEATDESQGVNQVQIQIDHGPENLRAFVYTGEATVVTGDQGDTLSITPFGRGEAQYPKSGDTPAATYKGLFVDGLPHDGTGTAEMVFDNGDKYVGTFDKGNYGKGTYALGNGGSIYQGSFKNGAPTDGYWYTHAGHPISRVSAGKEIADTAGIPPYQP